MMAATVIYQAGVMTERIAKVEQADVARADAISVRLARIEASDAEQRDKFDIINQRGGRIEAKLDLLVPDKRSSER